MPAKNIKTETLTVDFCAAINALNTAGEEYRDPICARADGPMCGNCNVIPKSGVGGVDLYVAHRGMLAEVISRGFKPQGEITFTPNEDSASLHISFADNSNTWDKPVLRNGCFVYSGKKNPKASN